MLATIYGLIAQHGPNPCAEGCDTYHQFRGMAAVAVAVILFVGAPAFILATNVGVRKGIGITLATLFAYLAIHGLLWMIYPRGPFVRARSIGPLPPSLVARLPAILMFLGGAALTAIFCWSLNYLDRPRTDEPTLKE